MIQQHRLPKNYWIGFLILALAYTLVQFLFYHPVIPVLRSLLKYKQSVRWFNITFVYVVGIMVIRTMHVNWLLFIWNIVHVVMIGYLLLAAAYEYLIAPLPYGIRGSVAPIVEFLISPIIYMAMGLLYAGTKNPE
jgi:hypothetical protein